MRRFRNKLNQHLGSISPEVLLCELTTACNSRCVGCGYRDAMPGELSATQWGSVIWQGQQLGFSEILLTGGEPLLHPGFDAIRQVAVQAAPTDVHTNGLLLERRALDGVRTIYVSLDAATEASYRSVRGCPGLKRIRKGVAAHPHARFVARTTLWGLTASELRDIVGLAEQLGFAGMSVLAPDLSGDQAFAGAVAPRNAIIPAEGLGALRSDLDWFQSRSLCEQSTASIERTFALVAEAATGQRVSAPTCHAPWTSVVVGSTGALRPCFFVDGRGDVSAGLQNGLRRDRSLRRQIQVKRDETCRRCVCWG